MLAVIQYLDMNQEEPSQFPYEGDGALKLRAERFAQHLLEKFGPVVYREDLVNILGFASQAAFDRAYQRGHLKLVLMKPPNRHGVGADAWEVARHLAEIPRELPGPERKVDR